MIYIRVIRYTILGQRCETLSRRSGPKNHPIKTGPSLLLLLLLSKHSRPRHLTSPNHDRTTQPRNTKRVERGPVPRFVSLTTIGIVVNLSVEETDINESPFFPPLGREARSKGTVWVYVNSRDQSWPGATDFVGYSCRSTTVTSFPKARLHSPDITLQR
ncbi:hypothetical protein RRG08_038901 [Elysia crispata]|uniref:Uncharacterized protein n=1 Tax=Elysia crispata TaxID=231223 RepID=A0AAE0Y770_9GAST|nr:hypothetical protein RRG08_038901 [Elysia crispata]